jgi:hypothetical protein
LWIHSLNHLPVSNSRSSTDFLVFLKPHNPRGGVSLYFNIHLFIFLLIQHS